MKNIILKRLKLTNFKGIKDKTINFNDNITSIYGRNGAGKTTIFDAFTWILFGKDSLGKKDFGIKEYDKIGKTIPKIEHEVEAGFNIDGVDTTLKLIFREKWVTKKGMLEPEFKGHETTYFFNDVPMKQEEYKKKINEIIDEEIFKLITNPSYFQELKWQDRRKILFQMVSEQSDYEFANSCPDFKELAKTLETKTSDEIKREIAAKKKKIKTEMEAIPARIDEVTKGMPEGEDWEELKKKVNAKKEFIDHIQKQIEEAICPSENNLKIKRVINGLEERMLEYKNKVNNEYRDKKNIISQSITEINNKISESEIKAESCNRKISDINKELSDSKRLIESLREKIKNLNNKVFDESSTVCPVCGRAYESDKIDEMKRHFEESKIAEFKNLNERGRNLKSGMEGLEKSLSKAADDKKELEKNIDGLKISLSEKQEELNKLEAPNLLEDKEYIKMEEEKEKLLLKLDKPTDISDLTDKKYTAENELEELQKRLLKEERIAEGKNRIKELEESHRELAVKNAELDKKEFEIQYFIKAKIENLESSINSKFDIVKFKLFETQINGAEVECCEITASGVPYHDLNGKMKLNTGLDIINGLCKNYGIYAPVFIDNRERATDIINVESQLINLIVSAEDEKLRVEADNYGK